MAWIAEKKRVNRVTNKTETYYLLAWRDEAGKVKTKGLGFCTKDEAKTALKVAEARLATGEAVVPTPIDDGLSARGDHRKTLDMVLDAYLPVLARDRAKKTHGTGLSAKKNISPSLGKVAIADLDFRMVDAHIARRLGSGASHRTVQLELWLLRAALGYAVKCAWIEKAPELPVVRDKRKRPTRYLTTDECQRLLDAIRPIDRQSRDPTIHRDGLSYLAVLMALNLGLRKGEILTREWCDIRWSQGKYGALLVDAKPAIGFEVKTRRARIVPLTPEVRTELDQERVLRGDAAVGWIFTSPADASKPRQDFRIALVAACRRAGIQQIHPHGLRHTWASRMALSGTDRRTILEVGGWTNGAMLDDIYAHVSDIHKESVMAGAGIGPSTTTPPPKR